MKKKIIIICAIVLSLALSVAAVVSYSDTMIRNTLQGGRWVNKEGVAFTFANDTLLYIDDIHSDGAEYIYRIDFGNILVVREINSPSDIPTEEEAFEIIDVGGNVLRLSTEEDGRLIFFRK